MRLAFNRCADCRVDSGNVIETLNQRPKIEHAAAHQNRSTSPRQDAVNAGSRIVCKISGGIEIDRLANVNQVMGVIGFRCANR